MRVLSWRFALLSLCTVSAFVVLGRAPGAVNLRTREIEFAIGAEGKSGRIKKPIVAWRGPAIA